MEINNFATLNEETKVVSMQLYGSIGGDINGHLFASAIDEISVNYDNIQININSEGGSVFHGLSIVSAMRRSSATITTVVDGVAASMAGVIAVSGDVVNMVDYGQIMVHNPHYGRKAKTAKEKNAIASMRETLVNIFNNRDIDAELLDKMMTAETWLNAEKSKELNLIDNIVSTGKAVDLLSFENIAQMVACAQKVATNIETKKDVEMQNVLNHFGLSEDAKQEDVLNKVKEIENAHKQAVEGLENKISEKNEKIAKLLVNAAIESGKISEDKREEMENVAKSNEEAFNAIINAVEVKNNVVVDVKDVINEDSKVLSLENMTKEEIFDLMDNDPQKYDELLNNKK